MYPGHSADLPAGQSSRAAECRASEIRGASVQRSAQRSEIREPRSRSWNLRVLAPRHLLVDSVSCRTAPRVTLLLALVAAAPTNTHTTRLAGTPESVAGCTEAKSYVRDVALAKMPRPRQRLDAYLAARLLLARRWGPEDADAGARARPRRRRARRRRRPHQHQVPGVDEADFVKNDASTSTSRRTACCACRCVAPDQTHEVAKVELPVKPRKCSSMATARWSMSRWARRRGRQRLAAAGCTYGYDATSPGRTQTKMMIFDIGVRAAPRLVREVDLAAR